MTAELAISKKSISEEVHKRPILSPMYPHITFRPSGRIIGEGGHGVTLPDGIEFPDGSVMTACL